MDQLAVDVTDVRRRRRGHRRDLSAMLRPARAGEVAAPGTPPKLPGPPPRAGGGEKKITKSTPAWGGGPKASQSLRPQAQIKVLIIFSGDMCVGENTFRLANVRVVRQRRTARPASAHFFKREPSVAGLFESVSKIFF